jgi:hypothetical protein
MPTDYQPPMPPVPTHITVDGNSYPLYEPFYYGTLNSFYVYYPVAREEALQSLALEGFTPYRFADGSYVVAINFESYTAQGGAALETVNEVEFNLIAVPTAWAGRAPRLSLQEFLQGQDQTKTIGHLRLHVPCDNPFAIAAGKALYTEPKFLAAFQYLMPALNLPVQHAWSITCAEPAGPNGPGATIFQLEADLRGAPHWPGNPSPLVEFGTVEGRPVMNYWTLFGPLSTIHPLSPETQAKIQLTIGQSGLENMAADMRALIGDGKPLAVQIFRSQPCAVECRAAYCDIV